VYGLSSQRSGLKSVTEVSLKQGEEEMDFSVMGALHHGLPIQSTGLNDSAKSMFLESRE
tara:strand:+ start:522 stop:698 length:177 start_codon:yes stop_codon:yes gene_type:complete